MASFTLQCIICPNDPTFSDVSHLLTHMGSKGHLSHYFKAQVRGRQDVSTQEKLQSYDRWYQDNDIEQLLSQRLNNKESKPRSRRSVKGSEAASSANRSQRKRARDELSASKDDSHDVIDPSLSQTEHIALHRPSLPVTPPPREIAGPQKVLVHASRWNLPLCNTRVALNAHMGDPRHANVSNGIVRPTNLDPVHLGRLRGRPSYSPAPSEDTAIVQTPTRQDHDSVRGGIVDDIIIDDDSVSESSRLKGIVWPGMDLFDSASPEAKKMRNQKKNRSVLSQMETNSELVEPTEVIYFPSWEVKKERFISGEVESSPILDFTPKPKRRYSRMRKTPLADADVNVSRAPKKSRSRKLTAPMNDGVESDRSSLNDPYPECDGLPAVSGRFKVERGAVSTLEDPDLDWHLTAGMPGPRRGQIFLNVYRDLPGTDMHEHTTSSIQRHPSIERPPSQTKFHESRHSPFMLPNPFTNASYSVRGGSSTFDGLPSINSREGISARRAPNRSHVKCANGKENIEPIIDSHGRIEGLSSSHTNENYRRYQFQPTRGLVQRHNTPYARELTPFHQHVPPQSSNPLTLNVRGHNGTNGFGIDFAARSRPVQSTLNLFHPADHQKVEYGESSGDETIDQGTGNDMSFFA